MKTLMALVLAFCSSMTAQITSYLGPGILSRGAGDIGTRAGQDVDLRFYVSATGVYDNGLEPYSVDGAGKLVTVSGLYGTEIAGGAYGVHKWRHAKLGLDYKGTYRHYTSNSFYDGTDHVLALGYTYQKSRRLIFDLRQEAGSVSQANGFNGSLPVLNSAVVTPSNLLFDNRANYLQSTMQANYVLSAHTVLTLGGAGFGIWRKAPGLIGTQGYQLNGAIQHRISSRTTLGVGYQHMHFDYPKAFGQADVNSVNAIWATQLGRFWTASAKAGVYQAEVEGLQQVAVDPEITALLGITSTVRTFYQKSTFPQWNVTLGRKFQRANLSFNYANGVSSGNGVYLTSRSQTGGADFSYTATRKWSFSVSGGYSRLSGIGQNLQPFSQINGGVGATYAVTSPIHLVARVDARHQEITDATFRQTSYRASIGISFSPGDIPLAFH